MSDLPDSHASLKGTRDWPHAPPHRLAEAGVYFLTARAAEQRPLLLDDAFKTWFQDTLLEQFENFGWRPEAWAVLSNHYHFVAHSPDGSAETLRPMVRALHSHATRELNRRENQPGRSRLWQNYRETRITYQRSYLARLNYVHQNAVHHGLVVEATDYPWCSAARFEEAVTPAWKKTIATFRYEQIAKEDGDV